MLLYSCWKYEKIYMYLWTTLKQKITVFISIFRIIRRWFNNQSNGILSVWLSALTFWIWNSSFTINKTRNYNFLVCFRGRWRGGWRRTWYKPPVADYREVNTSQPASLITRKYKQQQLIKGHHFYYVLCYLFIDLHTRWLRVIYVLG